MGEQEPQESRPADQRFWGLFRCEGGHSGRRWRGSPVHWAASSMGMREAQEVKCSRLNLAMQGRRTTHLGNMWGFRFWGPFWPGGSSWGLNSRDLLIGVQTLRG